MIVPWPSRSLGTSHIKVRFESNFLLLLERSVRRGRVIIVVVWRFVHVFTLNSNPFQSSVYFQNKVMADEENNADNLAGYTDGNISPEHRLNDGEKEDRSPTRSPEGSPRASDDDDELSDSEENTAKRKRSLSPVINENTKDKQSDETDFELSKPKRKKERHMWSLPDQLASYFNDLSREFFEDDDLRDEFGVPIKEVNPVPENIQKVPKLDNFLEEDWKEKKFLVENDSDVARVQERIRDVMGPLSKVWLTLEGVKKRPR